MASKAKGSRPKGPSSSNQLKATGIILLCFIAVVAFFAFFNNDKGRKDSKQHRAASPYQTVKPKLAAPLPSVAVVPRPGPVKKKAPIKANGQKIAFVIDDWGQTTQNCRYLEEITDPIAIAILPNLKKTEDVAKCAKRYGKTVMLHLPLEAYKNNDPYPTDYLIKTNMKPSKIISILDMYLARMPWVEGVNNHMGSKATDDVSVMRIILKKLKRKGLFFVDSMTAPKNVVCAKVAQETGVPFAQRDVFLDNINTKEAILVQFDELVAKALRKGSAIAIGHDRALTMRVIKEQIPVLKAMGFEIVDIKSLLKKK